VDSSHINLSEIAGKTIKTTTTNKIFKIINRFKRGVDIPKLEDRAGFDGNKTQNIICQLSNQGKTKTIS